MHQSLSPSPLSPDQFDCCIVFVIIILVFVITIFLSPFPHNITVSLPYSIWLLRCICCYHLALSSLSSSPLAHVIYMTPSPFFPPIFNCCIVYSLASSTNRSPTAPYHSRYGDSDDLPRRMAQSEATQLCCLWSFHRCHTLLLLAHITAAPAAAAGYRRRMPPLPPPSVATAATAATIQ